MFKVVWELLMHVDDNHYKINATASKLHYHCYFFLTLMNTYSVDFEASFYTLFLYTSLLYNNTDIHSYICSHLFRSFGKCCCRVVSVAAIAVPRQGVVCLP